MSEYPPPLWFLDPTFQPKELITKDLARSLGVCRYCKKAIGNHKTPASRLCHFSKQSRDHLTKEHQDRLLTQPEDDTYVASNVNSVLDPAHVTTTESQGTRTSPRRVVGFRQKRLIEEDSHSKDSNKALPRKVSKKSQPDDLPPVKDPPKKHKRVKTLGQKIGKEAIAEKPKIDVCKICKLPDASESVSTTLIVCEAEILSYYNCTGEYGCGKWYHVGCVDRTEVPVAEWLCMDCSNRHFGVHNDEDDDIVYDKKGLEITDEFRADMKAEKPFFWEHEHYKKEISECFPVDGVCVSPQAKKQTRDHVLRYFNKTAYRFATEQLRSFHRPGLLEYALQRGLLYAMKHAQLHKCAPPPSDIIHEVRLGLSDWIDVSEALIELFKDSKVSPTSQDIEKYIKDHPIPRYLSVGEYNHNVSVFAVVCICSTSVF